MLICFVIAFPAWLLVHLVPALQIVGAPIIAIIVGMLVALMLKDRKNLDTGIGFTSKIILQSAVVLLGFGLNLATIGQVGMESLPVILSTISTSLIVAFVACSYFLYLVVFRC